MGIRSESSNPEPFEAWDPLSTASNDPGWEDSARRREIRNILKSYTGYYDVFAELLQNALDAVERRAAEGEASYSPTLWITVDMDEPSISVTDNGCGMSEAEFKHFLTPNYSFKGKVNTRGSKGVGATYLAYGFNHLEVATKYAGKTYCGTIIGGRDWVEDSQGTIGRPKVAPGTSTHEHFQYIDRGSSMVVRLYGEMIRPKDLNYNLATTSDQWLTVLRVTTPLGGIYLCEDTIPANVTVYLDVIHEGIVTQSSIVAPQYVFPHEVFPDTADIREYMKWQKKAADKSSYITKVPAKFKNLIGIWGQWTGEEYIEGAVPINAPELTAGEIAMIRELDLKLYLFLGYSTDIWDAFNDERLKLRKNGRLLKGGLQISTRHMPQGPQLTIPLLRNIGYQNVAHVIVHIEAEPDLGRKGFQPEHVAIAEKLAVHFVRDISASFYHLLRKKTGAPTFDEQVKLEDWIEHQKQHREALPLVITGRGLFLPREQLPIQSIPIVEQDVVALFNQMLSAGLIRGVQILSSSQYKQYDGLYQYVIDLPIEKYLYDPQVNPLGVRPENIPGAPPWYGPVHILEYKHNLDALFEEFSTEEKRPQDIRLAIAWEMGTKWQEGFNVLSYLDSENIHHRPFHGFTHSVSHAMTGTHAFEVIILKDLIEYLREPDRISAEQHRLYSDNLFE